MTSVFILGAFVFLIYAILNIPTRPGLFAATIVNSYVFSNYLGPIGIFMGVLALLVSVGTLARRGTPVLQKPEIGLLAWLFVSIASVAASLQIDVGFFYAGSLLILCIGTYMFGRTFGAHPSFLPDLVLGACITLVLCEPGLIAATRDIQRVSGDLNAVGASLMVDIPIVGCLALLFFNDHLSKRQAFGTMAFVIFVVLPVAISLGTRSVFLGAAIVFAIYLLFRMRRKNKKGLIFGLAGAVGMVAAAIAGVWVMLSSAGLPPAFLGSLFRIGMNFSVADGAPLDKSSLLRIENYENAKYLILNSPIFGYSLGAFSYMANNSQGSYPHNMFLEILVNNGIVGLLLFLFWIGPLASRGAAKLFQPTADWTAFFAFGLLVDSLVRLQVSFTIVQGKMLFLALGILLAQFAAGQVVAPKRSILVRT